jgi:hypothetical protein
MIDLRSWDEPQTRSRIGERTFGPGPSQHAMP